MFQEYQNAVKEESNLWDIANNQYLLHGFTSPVTWESREVLIEAKHHSMYLWREYRQLLDGALVYDLSLPEANRVQAELLIEAIVSAVALGEVNRLPQLEEQFHRHVKYVSDDERLMLQNRLMMNRSNPVTMLRIQRGTMIGRNEVLNNTIDLIQDNPLVTLVGAAGMGKSRVAIEATHHLKSNFDGVYFCDLSTTDRTWGVGQYRQINGVGTCESRPFAAADSMFINTKTLLVLDNLEHIPELCSKVIGHWYK